MASQAIANLPGAQAIPILDNATWNSIGQKALDAIGGTDQALRIVAQTKTTEKKTAKKNGHEEELREGREEGTLPREKGGTRGTQRGRSFIQETAKAS